MSLLQPRSFKPPTLLRISTFTSTIRWVFNGSDDPWILFVNPNPVVDSLSPPWACPPRALPFPVTYSSPLYTQESFPCWLLILRSGVQPKINQPLFLHSEPAQFNVAREGNGNIVSHFKNSSESCETFDYIFISSDSQHSLARSLRVYTYKLNSKFWVPF